MEEWYKKQDFYEVKKLELILSWAKGDKIEFIADDSYYKENLDVA